MGGRKLPLEIYRSTGRPFRPKDSSAKKQVAKRTPKATKKSSKSSKVARGSLARGVLVQRISRLPVMRLAAGCAALVLILGFLYSDGFTWLSQGVGGATGLKRLSRPWPAPGERTAPQTGWWVQVASGGLDVSSDEARQVDLDRWEQTRSRLERRLTLEYEGATVRLLAVGTENQEVLLCVGWAEDKEDPWLHGLLEVVRSEPTYSDAMLIPLRWQPNE
jgi:hypothetical protein